MCSEDLDRALGQTPKAFAVRMDMTLRMLKEERKMKKTTFRTVLVFVLAAAMLCTTAFALVSQGLEWYYDNRFTAYQQHEPEKYDAIMANLQTDVVQTVTEDPAVRIAVTETSWALEQRVLVTSVMAVAADPEHTELHPMWNMDADGAYVGPDGAADPAGDGEDRAVHWLWTTEGFGPVEEMVAPGKQLILLECDSVLLNGEHLLGDGSSVDAYVTGSGAVHTVLEVRLDEAQAAQLLASDTDGDGVITLIVPYTVTEYTGDDAQLYTGGRTGSIAFELNIR